MEHLGLGADVIAAANPRIVYLRLPGFASKDQGYSDVPGWEGALGAFCGLFTELNIPRANLRLPPVYSALPHASVYAAVHGALAVTLALLARRQTGRGDTIEVPLAAAGLSAMGSAAMRITPQPSRYDLPELGYAMRHLAVPLVRALAGCHGFSRNTRRARRMRRFRR